MPALDRHTYTDPYVAAGEPDAWTAPDYNPDEDPESFKNTQGIR